MTSVRLPPAPVTTRDGRERRRRALAARIPGTLGPIALFTVLAFLGLVGLWGLAGLDGSDRGAQAWRDGSRHGDWVAVFDGYGETTDRVDGADQVISLAPQVATEPGTTHAALVVTATHYSDVHMSTELRTVRQLRIPEPAPWEVGWVLWDYTDPAHFYAFALKPNGWELSKQDPAYPGGQRFLASGEAPRLSLTIWHTVEAIQSGATIAVSVDGVPTVMVTDTERPYPTGAVGLYCEDSVVEFRRTQARSGPP